MANNVFTGYDQKLGVGASDDFYMQHNGTNSILNNDTGNTYIYSKDTGAKTIFDDSSNDNDIVIDHANDLVGFGTATPSYPIHLLTDASTNAEFSAQRTSGAQAEYGATAGIAYVGSRSNHPLWLMVNAGAAGKFDTGGVLFLEYVYGNDLAAGAGKRTIIMDNTYALGYDSSWREGKTEIESLTEPDVEFIRNLNPVKYKLVNGDGTIHQGFIADEVENVFQKASFSETFKVKADGTHEPITSRDYDNAEELRQSGEKDKKIKKIAKKIIGKDKDDKAITEDVEIEIEKVAAGVEKGEIIPALVKTVQLLLKKVEALEKK